MDTQFEFHYRLSTFSVDLDVLFGYFLSHSARLLVYARAFRFAVFHFK